MLNYPSRAREPYRSRIARLGGAVLTFKAAKVAIIREVFGSPLTVSDSGR
jgi:hypothetical protein